MTVKKIIGITLSVCLMAILTIGRIVEPKIDSIEASLLMGLTILILWLTFKPKKEKVKTNMQILKENGVTAMATLPHTSGLPVANGILCSIHSYSDRIHFKANNMEFNLDKEKITDVAIATSTEIQKSYVSSVGGAVGGAVLFGPLGAIVGGRAKEKESRTITKYLIFTYKKDDEIQYISFDTSGNFVQSNQFVAEFSATLKNNTVIDL